MFFKGATKLYFTHYLCGHLLSTGLYKSAFSICSFAKLVFRLSVLWFFVFLWFLVFCLMFSTQCHLIRLKVVLSPSKQRSLFLQWKPFKNDEKCFLFHFKSSFPPQDNSTFVLTFWPCRKSDSIRYIRLISKFMTSQPG